MYPESGVYINLDSIHKIHLLFVHKFGGIVWGRHIWKPKKTGERALMVLHCCAFRSGCPFPRGK